jgi:hypothetical protein
MSLGCLAAMKNANPPDQCRKLITPNDDITMGACADKDLDRRKFVDVLSSVFNSFLQRDEFFVLGARDSAVNCDRSGGIHQHHSRQLRLHKLSESHAYEFSAKAFGVFLRFLHNPSLVMVYDDLRRTMPFSSDEKCRDRDESHR